MGIGGLMEQVKWNRWIMQTAVRWEDLADLVSDTGIEIIDLEHRRLIEDILNMGEIATPVAAATYDSKQFTKQEELLKQLHVSIQQHFETEEYFIDRYKLPGKEKQLQEHNTILEIFNSIVSDFEGGILSTFQTMKIDLIEALICDINQYDTETFKLENFTPALVMAKKWEDVAEIIKSTGIPFVDDEHKQLTIQIINLNSFLLNIGYQIVNNSQKEIVLDLTGKLYHFTETHFNNEVRFLEKYQLPTGNQTKEHEIFLGTMSDKKKQFLAGNFEGMDELVAFLLNWWVSHINGIDYVEFHYSRIIEAVFTKTNTLDDLQWLIRKSELDQVDEEHTNIFNSIIRVCSLDIQEENPSALKIALDELYKEAELHFEHEETIMKRDNLKGYEAHQESHRKMLQNISEAASHIVSGRSQVSSSLLKRLMLWLFEHTNGMDYETFVLKHATM